MYICIAPGLRLNDGKVAAVGEEIPEAKDWPHHIVDMHIRNGKIRYEGKPEDRVTKKPVAPPKRPTYSKAERERLAALPEHQRELMATRRGWPAHWLHEPAEGPEPAGEGVQLTKEQRQLAYAEMPSEVVAMAAKARGVTVEELTGRPVKKANVEGAPAAETAPAPEPVKKANVEGAPAAETAPAPEPAKKGKGR